MIEKQPAEKSGRDEEESEVIDLGELEKTPADEAVTTAAASAARRLEEVAAVRVRVQEARVEQLRERALDAELDERQVRRRDREPRDAGAVAVARLAVEQLVAVDPFEREHVNALEASDYTLMLMLRVLVRQGLRRNDEASGAHVATDPVAEFSLNGCAART